MDKLVEDSIVSLIEEVESQGIDYKVMARYFDNLCKVEQIVMMDNRFVDEIGCSCMQAVFDVDNAKDWCKLVIDKQVEDCDN